MMAKSIIRYYGGNSGVIGRINDAINDILCPSKGIHRIIDCFGGAAHASMGFDPPNGISVIYNELDAYLCAAIRAVADPVRSVEVCMALEKFETLDMAEWVQLRKKYRGELVQWMESKRKRSRKTEPPELSELPELPEPPQVKSPELQECPQLELLERPELPPPDSLEAISEILMLYHCAFQGDIRSPGKCLYEKYGAFSLCEKLRKNVLDAPSYLYNVKEFWQRDVFDILADPSALQGSLLYLDPPWYGGSAESYPCMFGEDEHKRMVEMLLAIDNPAVILGYDTELYNPLLENGFKKIVLRYPTSGIQQAVCLWVRG